MRTEQLRRSSADGAAMEQMAQFFKVLGDSTRVRLLLRLADSKQCVSQLAEELGLSGSAVSHHLRLLDDQSKMFRGRVGASTDFSNIRRFRLPSSPV